MAMQNLKKRKFALVIIISWLWVRLKLTVELSRLAIFRILTRHQIQHVSFRNSSLPPPTFWTYDNEQFTCMNFDRERRIFIIHALPPFSKS